jgi:molecular chaperone GrpE (heat shock protein)
MSNYHRQVWATLSRMLDRLEQDLEREFPKGQGSIPSDGAKLEDLEQELRKLGRVQFKANALTEEQMARWDKTLAELELAKAQRAELVERLVAERLHDAKQAWLASLLPVLDGLDNAMASGKKYLVKRDQAAQTPDLSPEQQALISPADRSKLASWLDGLRLVRERLLAVLEEGGVIPIPTVGHPFDPYRHVAVATTSEGAEQPGTIVAEERRGYQADGRVLRYADVVVYRPDTRDKKSDFS